MKRPKIRIIHTNNDSFLSKRYIVMKKGDFSLLGFLYGNSLFIFEVTSFREEKVYYDNSDYFSKDISHKSILKDGEDIRVLDFLKEFTILSKSIKYIKKSDSFLNQYNPRTDIIPVYQDYLPKRDDNLEYYMDTFYQSLRTDPAHPLSEVFRTLLITFIEEKMKEIMTNRRFDIARNLLENFESIIDETPRLLYVKALYFYNSNQLYEAAEVLFDLLGEKNMNNEGVVLLTRILDELEKTDQSIKIIEEYLADNEVEDIVILEYLRLLLKTEQIADMGEMVEKFRGFFEDHSESKAYFIYYDGIYSMIKGDIPDALEKFEKIRGTAVDDLYLRLNMLQIYRLLGMKEEFFKEKDVVVNDFNVTDDIRQRIEMWEKDFDNVKVQEIDERDEEIGEGIKKAIEEAEEFVKNNPENPWGFYSLGSLYLKVKDYDRSEENFRKSLEIEEENGIVLHGMGLLYSKRDENQKAIEYFKKAIIAKPDENMQKIYSKWKYDPNLAYFSLADAYIRLKKIDEAIVVLKKGIEFDASSFMPHFQLGTCYEYNKEYFKALENYMNAKRLNPEFYLVDFYIANCYMVLKDYEKARKHIETYIDNDTEKAFIDYAYELLKKIKDKLDLKD